MTKNRHIHITKLCSKNNDLKKYSVITNKTAQLNFESDNATISNTKNENFVLMRDNTKLCYCKYYVICGQPEYCNKIQKEKENENYVKLFKIEDVNDPYNRWNRLKEKLENKVEFCANHVYLINIDQEDFINAIDSVYDRKKVIYSRY